MNELRVRVTFKDLSPGRGEAIRAVLTQLVRLTFDACIAPLNSFNATPSELVSAHESSAQDLLSMLPPINVIEGDCITIMRGRRYRPGSSETKSDEEVLKAPESMAAYKASLLLKVRGDAEMVGAKLTANIIKIAIIRGPIFSAI